MRSKSTDLSDLETRHVKEGFCPYCRAILFPPIACGKVMAAKCLKCNRIFILPKPPRS